MSQRLLAVFTASAITGVFAVAVPVAAAAATIVDLGTLPGGTFSNAEDINSAGTIVGASGVRPNVWHAVTWDKRGVIRDLGTLPGDTSSYGSRIGDSGAVLGSSDAKPVRWSPSGAITELLELPDDHIPIIRGMNNAGTVVGYSRRINGEYDYEDHAVRWDADTGAATALTLPPGTTGSVAWAVNDSGVIAGHVRIAGGERRAVRWNTDGTVTILDLLGGGTYSYAEDINDAGVVVGHANGSASEGLRTVRWSPTGAVTALANLPGGNGSNHMAINDNGVIAGYAGTSNQPHAVRWSATGAVTDLGTLSGHDRSFGRDMNADGTVVGDSDLFSDRNSTRAVRWAPNGTTTNLGLLPGGTYSIAYGINDSGTIFGNANTAGDDNHGFVWRAG